MKKRKGMDSGRFCIVLCAAFCLAYTIMLCRLADFTFYDPDPATRIRNLALAAPGGLLFYLTALKINRRRRARQRREAAQCMRRRTH